MSTRTSPCGWAPSAPCSSGPCCPDVDSIGNLSIKAQAESLATSIIWRLTGQQYGCCEVEVRPSKPRTCDPLTLAQVIYWDSRNLAYGAGSLGVLNFFPTLIGGQVYNISCGCPTGCCKCRSDCEVLLPGPVCSVTKVTVDGHDLHSGTWRVFDDNTLSFDPAVCPGCQNYNLTNGAVGTWSVTYTVGIPVPDELNFAAGLYACEIAKSLVSDKSCALPARVQQVARQGINTTYLDPVTLTNAGLTGLPLVDQIIRAVNPNQLTQPVRVWAPGLYRSRTQDQ